MKIDLALREAHAAEASLGGELRRVGEQHKAEHDVFHLTRKLARWSDAHVAKLAEEGARYELDLDGASSREGSSGGDRGVVAAARERTSELLGRRPEPGVLLLRDLRELHLAACRASLAWTILGQGAQAVSDGRLLETVTACHPETIRTMKWTVQKAKEAAPQVLAS